MSRCAAARALRAAGLLTLLAGLAGVGAIGGEGLSGRSLLVQPRRAHKVRSTQAPAKNPEVDPLMLVPANYAKSLAGVPMNSWYHLATTHAFRRVYSSPACKWAYFTTLKSASKMHQEAMMLEPCGYKSMEWEHQDNGLWHTCGQHHCEPEDLKFISANSTYKLAWVREPITRAIRMWNYAVPMKHTEAECGKHCTQERRAELLGKWTEDYLKQLEDRTLEESHAVQHFQPQWLFTCVLGQCMHGTLDFVGRADYADAELKRLNTTGVVGAPIPASVLDRRHITNPDRNRHLKIDDGTPLPESTLLSLCKLYWNDFMCFGYELPAVCASKLDFPRDCIDLQGKVYEPHRVDSMGVQIPRGKSDKERVVENLMNAKFMKFASKDDDDAA